MRLHNVYSAHPSISLACIIVVILVLAFWGKGVIGRNRRRGGIRLGLGSGNVEKTNGATTVGGNAPGFFHVDGKEGLLGNGTPNVNGKVD